MEVLKKMILEAFSDMQYPGDDKLTMNDSKINKNQEISDTWSVLKGKLWVDMPVEEFFQCDTPIPDLTPEAFRYYLPALLLASLDDRLDISEDIATYLVFYLSPYNAIKTSGPKYTNYNATISFGKRLSMFNTAQKRAIGHVLREYVKRGYEESDSVEETLKFFESE